MENKIKSYHFSPKCTADVKGVVLYYQTQELKNNNFWARAKCYVASSVTAPAQEDRGASQGLSQLFVKRMKNFSFPMRNVSFSLTLNLSLGWGTSVSHSHKSERRCLLVFTHLFIKLVVCFVFTTSYDLFCYVVIYNHRTALPKCLSLTFL